MKTPLPSGKMAFSMRFYLLIPFIVLTLLLSGCMKGRQTEPIADDSFFISREDSAETAEDEHYQCIRLRRGDVIELYGTVIQGASESGNSTLLKTAAGRTFILDDKGSIPAAGSIQNGKVHLKGKILFEGNNEQPPILSVIEIK